MANNKLNYKIELNIDKDAWNWYDACVNDGSHGVNWSKFAPQDVLINIRGKSKTDAYSFIIPYLKQRYVDDEERISKAKDFFNSSFEKNFINACRKLEEVMGKPIYRKDFTIYLTTFPRAPYNYHEGYLYTCIDWVDPIATFLHELSHFQFIHYWRYNPESKVSELSSAEFEWLKESLTIILDEDFADISEKLDYGYVLHKPYRKELREHWKTNHNFDKLVDFGLSLLPKYKSDIENSDKLSTYEKITTPQDLQKFMSRNIHYGFVSRTGRKYFDGDKDWDKDWFNDCVIQSGDGVLKTKTGTCWDQVEFERKWFKDNNYIFKTIYFWYDVPESDDYPTHTILAYFKNNKWYWFENAFFMQRGIHGYNSLDELIVDIKTKNHQYAVDNCAANPDYFELIKFNEYTEPKPNLGVDDYIKHATNS